MAALLLSTAGASAGGALFGPPGAIAGRIAGAYAGNLIDRALIGGDSIRRTREGPRLNDIEVMASTEGAPIPRAYGRARLSGQVIWATKLEEVITKRSETSDGGGGKGGAGGGASVTTTTTTYSYFANFAVGLCEGPIGQVMRVWADGKPLDLAGINMRDYRGDEEQMPDPLIVAKDGEAPAYRGLAYVVFERLPVDRFGNRIPQLSFEIVRPVGALEQEVRAVTLIPGATEFGYERSEILRSLGPGQWATENRHIGHANSDVAASLDELQAVCPNIESVAIVIAWFGDKLGCRGPPARRRRSRLHDRGPSGFRRHAVGFERQEPDRGTERARAEGHALSFRDDGYSRRQCAGKSLYRRGAAAGLSLARRDHLRSGAGRGRLAGRQRGCGGADRCVLRERGPVRLDLSPDGSALRLARGGGRRRGRLPDRLGAEGPDARALGLRRLSCRRCAGCARG
jgi:hypothetical protein